MASRTLFKQRGFTENEEAVEKRALAFMRRLWQQPESQIAVFAHAEFLHHTVGKYFNLQEKWFKNGEVVRVELKNLPEVVWCSKGSPELYAGVRACV